MKCSVDLFLGFKWSLIMKNVISYFCNNGIYNVIMYVSNKIF